MIRIDIAHVNTDGDSALDVHDVKRPIAQINVTQRITLSVSDLTRRAARFKAQRRTVTKRQTG